MSAEILDVDTSEQFPEPSVEPPRPALVEQKDAIRRKLEDDIRDFLEHGGCVQQLDYLATSRPLTKEAFQLTIKKQRDEVIYGGFKDSKPNAARRNSGAKSRGRIRSAGDDEAEFD